MLPAKMNTIIDNMLDGMDEEAMNEIFNALTPREQSKVLFFGLLTVWRMCMHLHTESEEVFA